ncbi:MAG: N-acetylneuraminate synthase [Candidatus Sungbacteria bacterium RIFCSPLOWO2_02_FULL_54_10]|uniref:N-acetylneuraminate synthase n=2 Tax=Candidatus Sungiibacteriota TaxID=1817917 RepID=A0A1G2L5P9_9BACT|nr:MAG: N-acetylneuraminate synthase [Candidatus Sungbacteria bacterium RIFCSPHIGHO2_01_FULL_54_26]OHA03169.1 MAG: N-acetylneuraminate synthase [Candidatus Sungbacteria bacterium RIFCSPHIGHO2_02_FULL_53_17]OHA07007.1 MAG: N-acetylneuraminate synthase [Candidatus Sungbacteria bacterium RIFCSPLOWO2_01_FULL_54_21]OHA12785.1 MAG: N-acetylneuraminate synthase [Candidatus Sungbacteria bacterium RIFCSPLOWO2_02_FULL_54_10]
MKDTCCIIAEFGMLHEGSIGTALRMADAAKELGADAVKYQTHIADAETRKNAPMPKYFSGEPRWDYFTRTAFTLDQWKVLKAHCDKIGIEFISSPFSLEAVDLLEEVGMKRYKIPSGEVTNIPFLERVAKTGKPVILSSGMSPWKEIDRAAETIKKNGNHLTVVQCTSMYPTPPEKVGLNVMQEMAERYTCPVGLSDQSLTNYAGFAAAALGASIIEKHITLSRWVYGSDAKHSVEPDEFRDFVAGVRAIGKMRQNSVDKNDISAVAEMKPIFEKSVVAGRDLPAGHTLTFGDMRFKKPGTGLRADRYREVLGKKLKTAVRQDDDILPEAIL